MYTILSLMPTLSDQILVDQDVEKLIGELKGKSHSSQTALVPTAHQYTMGISSSSHEPDGRSDPDSLAASIISTSSGAVSLKDESLSSLSGSGIRSWGGDSQLSVSAQTTSENFVSLPSADGTFERSVSLSSSFDQTHVAKLLYRLQPPVRQLFRVLPAIEQKPNFGMKLKSLVGLIRLLICTIFIDTARFHSQSDGAVLYDLIIFARRYTA
jgi:hypothetical protein